VRLTYTGFENVFWDYFYPIFFLHAFLLMLHVNVGLHFFLYLGVIIFAGKKCISHKKRGVVEYLMLGYLGWNIFSSVAYLFNDMPFFCFINDARSTLIPLLFFFVAIYKRQTDRFYKILFISILVSLVVGLILFYTLPSWYIEWKVATAMETSYYDNEDVAENSFLNYGKMSSFFESPYFVATYSVVYLTILLKYIYTRIYSHKFLIFLFIGLLSLFCAQQRVAIVCGIGILVAFQVYGFFNKSKASFGLLILEIGLAVIVLLIVVNNERIFQILEAVGEKISAIDTALDERSYQYQGIMKRWTHYLFGHGLGTGGHSATEAGFVGVHDGNYYKLLFETGIIGLSWLGVIVVATLIRGFKYFRYYSIELALVCFYITSMLGANVLTQTFVVIPFWHSIGLIWNKEYLRNKMKLNDRI
jgi:hypothetical protein